jgi:hypothetical protein
MFVLWDSLEKLLAHSNSSKFSSFNLAKLQLPVLAAVLEISGRTLGRSPRAEASLLADLVLIWLPLFEAGANS